MVYVQYYLVVIIKKITVRTKTHTSRPYIRFCAATAFIPLIAITAIRGAAGVRHPAAAKHSFVQLRVYECEIKWLEAIYVRPYTRKSTHDM